MQKIKFIYRTLRSYFLKITTYNQRIQAKRYVESIPDGHYTYSQSVPYISQFANRERVRAYIKTKNFHDASWQDTGAKTEAEYIFWCDSICGMACLWMIMKSIDDTQTLTPHQLAQKATKYGVYKVDEKLNYIHGLFHRPFVDFIHSKYHLKGRLQPATTINMLAREVLQHNFVIASVHWSIRCLCEGFIGDTPIKISKGGHLVLITGVEISDGEVVSLILHNPSGFFEDGTQDHAHISAHDFMRCFSGNMIVVEDKKSS